jgi:hypothetical protein
MLEYSRASSGFVCCLRYGDRRDPLHARRLNRVCQCVEFGLYGRPLGIGCATQRRALHCNSVGRVLLLGGFPDGAFRESTVKAGREFLASSFKFFMCCKTSGPNSDRNNKSVVSSAAKQIKSNQIKSNQIKSNQIKAKQTAGGIGFDHGLPERIRVNRNGWS